MSESRILRLWQALTLLTLASSSGCLSSVAVHELPISKSRELSLETSAITGFQPGETSTTGSQFAKPFAQKESPTSDYDSVATKGLLGLGWSLGNPRL